MPAHVVGMMSGGIQGRRRGGGGDVTREMHHVQLHTTASRYFPFGPPEGGRGGALPTQRQRPAEAWWEQPGHIPTSPVRERENLSFFPDMRRVNNFYTDLKDTTGMGVGFGVGLRRHSREISVPRPRSFG